MKLYQNRPFGSQRVYRFSLLLFMYDFIQLKKDIFSKPSSGIGPAYARYYDSHTCHPTHLYYNRKRLHFQGLLENIFRILTLRFSVAWLFLLVVSQLQLYGDHYHVCIQVRSPFLMLIVPLI